MKHREGTLQGIRNTDIYHQCWLPEGETRAVILMVHGLAEHSGRYMNLVHHLIPKGYALYGFDHPGHGRSGGRRVYVDRFDDYGNTVQCYFQKIREWEPEKRIFIVLVSIIIGGIAANRKIVH